MKRQSLRAAEDETLDSFYHGRIHIIQKKKGYRFSVDAPLLADFIKTRASDILLELGGGNGIISLLLSRKPFRRIISLEIQESLADLARRNILLNRLEKRIVLLQQDLRAYRPKNKFDVIFSNPPYISKTSGHLSGSEEKSIAKHEIKCDIFDIMHLTGRVLKKNGHAYFIYPAKRKDDFDRALARSTLNIKTLRYVSSRSGIAPRWFLAECRLSPSRLKILSPLLVYDDRGEYTAEMKKIFAGETRGPLL